LGSCFFNTTQECIEAFAESCFSTHGGFWE